MTDSQIMQKYHLRYKSLVTTGRQCLVIFVGLPGSGKSTRARYLESLLPAARLSSDDIKECITTEAVYNMQRMFRLQADLCKSFLENGFNVIIDSNCDKEFVRGKYMRMATRYGAKVYIVHVECPTQLLIRRMWRRNLMRPSSRRHKVDFDTLLRHIAELETPNAHLTLQATTSLYTARQEMKEFFSVA